MASCKDNEQDQRVHGIAAAIRVVPDFPKKGIMFRDITTLLLNPKAFRNAVDLFVERYLGKDITVVAVGWQTEKCSTFHHSALCLRKIIHGTFLDWIATMNHNYDPLCPRSELQILALFVGLVVFTLHPGRGIEARGLIFGPPIALAIGAKFIPLRKPKKLPGEVISEKYDLEYGSDCLEMHVGAVQPGDRALVVDDLIATGGTLCAAMNLLERAGANVVEFACVIELPELKVCRDGFLLLPLHLLYHLVYCAIGALSLTSYLVNTSAMSTGIISTSANSASTSSIHGWASHASR
ncbi:hypothetical protein ZIOFF_066855 [Zingiber officinale]|uniref:adenine phosphoribosyltransferase n=1 Tax=Zingiber officinale TaxID=94328 RepID=A0A8J5KE95_ZINOF|nr:hypothetical protein ZIOFF_066855 [Zingiber officinale]